ncbi:hypothetical protein JCM11251_002889 [Rhodosporidiobolus azoricus]
MLLRSISVVLATASLAVAQSSSGNSSASSSATTSAIIPASTAALPSCALQCTLSSLTGTSCEQYGVSNITCICTDNQFQVAYYTCQTQSCSTQDLSAAEQYGAQICEQNGTPINIDETPSGYTGAPSTASATEPASVASSATRSAPVSASVSSVLESASSSAAAAASSAGAGGGGNAAVGAVRMDLVAVVIAGVAGGVALVAGAW